MPREGGKRQKRLTKSFLEMKKKEKKKKIIFFFVFIFFLETPRNAQTYRYDIIIYVCIKTLTLKHRSIITPENVSLVKFKYLRNGESLTTRADKFDFLRATGRLAFEPNLVESVGRIPGKVVAFPTILTPVKRTYAPVITPCTKERVFK